MLWQEMTGPDLRTAGEAGAVLAVPIGAVEQHGPHLPVGTDSLCAAEISREAVARLPAEVQAVLAPPLWYGYSHDHLGFAGTLSLPARVMEDVLVAIGVTAAASGFRRILFVNGHGGNDRLIYYALRRIRDAVGHDMCLAGVTYWKLASADLQRLRSSSPGGMGHACELETSLVLHFREDLVKMDLARREVPPPYSRYRAVDLLGSGAVVSPDMFRQRTSSGVTGDPTVATAEKGMAFTEAIAQELANLVTEFSTWPLSLKGEQ